MKVYIDPLQWRLIDEEGLNLPVVLDPVQGLDVHVLKLPAHSWLLVFVQILLEAVKFSRDIHSDINIVLFWNCDKFSLQSILKKQWSSFPSQLPNIQLFKKPGNQDIYFATVNGLYNIKR